MLWMISPPQSLIRQPDLLMNMFMISLLSFLFMFIGFVSEVSVEGPEVSKVKIYENVCMLIGVLVCVYLISLVMSYSILHFVIFPFFKSTKEKE